MTYDTGLLEQVFMRFRKAALDGARCPTADDLPPRSPFLCGQLAKEGKILIEISGRNWRTVTILVGDAAGKRTASDPHGHHVWRVIGKHHTINGKPWKAKPRAELKLEPRAHR